MEEDMTILDMIKEKFQCKGEDVRTYSPLPLAYIGDAVYELVIRTVVVERGNRSVNELHGSSIRYVNAGAQARIAQALLPSLTQEEVDVYRRGRNAKSGSFAKNASLADYSKATGLEALIGYLYLSGRTERALELCRQGLETLEKERDQIDGIR